MYIKDVYLLNTTNKPNFNGWPIVHENNETQVSQKFV